MVTLVYLEFIDYLLDLPLHTTMKIIKQLIRNVLILDTNNVRMNVDFLVAVFSRV